MHGFCVGEVLGRNRLLLRAHCLSAQALEALQDVYRNGVARFLMLQEKPKGLGLPVCCSSGDGTQGFTLGKASTALPLSCTPQTRDLGFYVKLLSLTYWQLVYSFYEHHIGPVKYMRGSKLALGFQVYSLCSWILLVSRGTASVLDWALPW
jgi:hypothetical protein